MQLITIWLAPAAKERLCLSLELVPGLVALDQPSIGASRDYPTSRFYELGADKAGQHPTG
jgi:hypothetical protein